MVASNLLLLLFFLPISAHGVMGVGGSVRGEHPLVVSTWPFLDAVRAAWRALEDGHSAVDAVVEGCSACEELRCDGTVGPGGSPDENGETTIDALIMNGITMEVGAVAAMRYVKDGIRAAKLVMDYTEHTLLVGEQASAFAISMGLPGPTNLSSPESLGKWNKWKENSCQPNFRKNTIPVHSCGPFHPAHGISTMIGRSYQCWNDKECSANLVEPLPSKGKFVNYKNHDTISMVVIDKVSLSYPVGANFKFSSPIDTVATLQARNIAVGTSTNGATFKIPGRVGDGPIPGSSSYADGEVGACGATGDGDIMMRFLPCYQVVQSMRLGMNPKTAAEDAILRIARKFPDFVGAVFAVNKEGVHAGACSGWTFQYSVKSLNTKDVEVFTVHPWEAAPTF